MRLTSLILLASAALAFTVQAQERHIVDVVLQVNGEIQTQDGQPPAPDVTAPRRQGQTNEPQPMGPAIPEVIAPKQPGKGVVQADAVDPFAPEVAAPKPRNHSLQANAVRPACPQVTAPRRESIGDAPKVNFDGAVASVDDEDETFDVVADGAKRKGRAKGKGHRTGKRHRTGKCQCKGGKMGEVPTRTTYPKFKVDVPGPEVTAPKMPGRRFEDEEPFADSADPEVTAPKVPGKGIKKIVKVKILRRGDDVVVGGAGDAVPGPDVTAPAPKVTAPIVETNGVTAPGPKVAAPSRPDKHIAEVKVRVNGKVVTDGDEALENVQVVIPDPDVTAPAPPKPGTTAPSNPDKHIAEAKVVHEESALEEKLSASNSEKKTAGLLDGLPDGLRDGLLDGLLGIDINLDGKKSKKAPADDDEKDWHHLRLYGDDGYEPRPLPVQPDAEPNCETLSFRDQMVRFRDPLLILFWLLGQNINNSHLDKSRSGTSRAIVAITSMSPTPTPRRLLRKASPRPKPLPTLPTTERMPHHLLPLPPHIHTRS